MLEIKVVSVRPVKGPGKIKGYASVEFGGVRVVEGFCIMRQRAGLVVHGPRKVASDAPQWFDVCIFKPEFWDRLEPLILDAYEAQR